MLTSRFVAGAVAAALAALVAVSPAGTALGAEDDTALAEAQVMKAVRDHFRPEFVNRLDEIILFHRLARAHMGGIVDIQLRHLRDLLAERKIELELDEAARDWLAEAGYDPVYGARPLKRVIQRELQNALAERILAGEIPDGTTVEVHAGPDGMTFERTNAVQAA